MGNVTKCSGCAREFTTTFLRNGRAHKCCAACRQVAKDRRERLRLADPVGVAREQRALRRKKREEALRAYGGECACCGEAQYEFLALDHIEGGGGRERRELQVWGSAFTAHLTREGFPPGYRVLCHNCNSALGYHGYCPHSTAYSAQHIKHVAETAAVAVTRIRTIPPAGT